MKRVKNHNGPLINNTLQLIGVIYNHNDQEVLMNKHPIGEKLEEPIFDPL